MLVAVEAARLGDRLRWEKSRGGALFPHLYGPLFPAEAASVDPLPLGPDGEPCVSAADLADARLERRPAQHPRSVAELRAGFRRGLCRAVLVVLGLRAGFRILQPETPRNRAGIRRAQGFCRGRRHHRRRRAALWLVETARARPWRDRGVYRHRCDAVRLRGAAWRSRGAPVRRARHRLPRQRGLARHAKRGRLAQRCARRLRLRPCRGAAIQDCRVRPEHGHRVRRRAGARPSGRRRSPRLALCLGRPIVRARRPAAVARRAVSGAAA